MSEPRTNMREWRTLKGLSQAELARRMGITKSEISRLEGGQRRLTVDWMEKVAAGLQIRREQLFESPPVYRNVEEQLADLNRRTVGAELGVKAVSASFELVAVEGDEMKGTFEPGDVVVVDRNRTSPAPAGLFVIASNGIPLIRRLQLLPDGTTIRVICDNKIYDAAEIDSAQVAVTGRVIGLVRRV